MTPIPTESDLRKAEHRGQQAKALLANPLLNEAFAKVDAECVRLWREAKDQDAREGCWVRLQALAHVRTAIEAVVKDGDIAQRKLAQLIQGKRPLF